MLSSTKSKSDVPEVHLFDNSDLSVPRTDQIITSFNPDVILRAKVVLVGDAECGKTSLVQSILSNGQNYPNKYNMTTEIDLSVNEVSIPDTNVTVDLFLYDVPGASTFHQRGLQSKHYNDASIVVCVFEVSSRKSFQSCSKWIQSVRSAQTEFPTNEVEVILVANKVDLRGNEDNGEVSQAEVDSAEGECFANDNGFKYFETSALDGYNVDSLFQHIATQLYNNR
ncbi:hypothetical protein ACHAXS_010253 [Conticribra weissflogii]